MFVLAGSGLRPCGLLASATRKAKFAKIRGFLLPRFVNAGRRHVAANIAPRPASKNFQESRHPL
tara:strand:- start:7 stop:198 length:192 start_codon:yes stop_codon:yes gene_type:complete